MEKEYILLFNGVSDAIDKLQELTKQLMDLQTQAEELFITKGE